MLNIDKLRFSFGSQKDSSKSIAMNFSLSVSAGEILSVIGPSGSGKTTLLNLIAGFLKPTAGEIWINDQEISQLKISNRPVTTVFQENNLFPHLDVFTNVAIGLQASLKLSNTETQQIHEALEKVGLADLIKRLPKELSGGQRQRVALARALVRKHSILLLDEPLAALGPAMRGEILTLLKQLVEREKMCALLISHQPDDALKVSARTAFIHQGKVLNINESDKFLSQSEIPEIRQYLGEI